MPETRTEPLIIGTRGSRLALWQAEEVQRLLPAEARLEIIRTPGDRIQDVSLQGGSTPGFFTREIEERLLADDDKFKGIPMQQSQTSGLCHAIAKDFTDNVRGSTPRPTRRRSGSRPRSAMWRRWP